MSDRKIRIAVLHFSHETVSFLPNETTLDDFIYPGSPAKGEALLQFDPKNYMGGFVQVAREFSEVELVPHYDAHLQGERAARMLVRAIRGDYKPAHRTIKVPVISPTVLQWTGARPWMDLVQRALVWEAREVDVYVNTFFGFPFADVPDVGMTVQVLTNDNPKLAEQVARDLAGTIWRLREALLAIKSRVHFRRGFDDNGFARTILLVEPEQPFLGTTRLDKLPYRNVDLARFYPYGDPAFLEASS
ncbi:MULTISPECIES: M81 family metallopeptidase [Bradyrhizobium]|uniref:Microcystin degradation protein MlrC n=1 Tax=Bradyrhizobium elkanii TaxID=29448 RepID=A0A8I2C5Z8_BRAEL|nr:MULTISPECIES: M81 family metallopeptidase [Bradyrhizobium]MBP1295598.1 microcystin degradation protein MlrC [Bradyrhizobium elkanii]MCP1933503.1 microcystin degradation protein MlrC [Bradyrhizobium elkanii]MCS3478488.1 microcystin degradation protein MlrC [Bradyrhizobium elkanii]MCS3585261.1 microcystin degradation protein MlrC [Bradyrhizobium elkanii]MCS3718836.1 microcystin degradation protein MlrC [Bradyrhizobium elkanii]